MEIDWQDAGSLVRDAMMRQGKSSDFVAHKAGVTRRTVDRLKSGQKVRIQTVLAIEPVLGVSIISQGGGPQDQELSHTAPDDLGGYNFASVEAYVGNYYLFRRSYDYPDRIICAQLSIFWDNASSHLKFAEHQQNKAQDGTVHTHKFVGSVSIPVGVGCIQLIRSVQGFCRVMTCTSLRGNEPSYMKGILVGMNEISDIGFHPATSPVYIEATTEQWEPNQLNAKIGSFEQDALWHGNAKAQLHSVTDKFVAT